LAVLSLFRILLTNQVLLCLPVGSLAAGSRFWRPKLEVLFQEGALRRQHVELGGFDFSLVGKVNL